MKLRNVLLGVAGTVGGIAVANRVLASDDSEFEPFLDGETGTYRWRGFDIAYTEHGDPENQDLLLIHGTSVAASSHEYHAVVDELSENFHIIAPDLPGFGRSDRPPLLYSGALYETFVEDAIADLTDEPPVVVGSSLSGSYVASAAETVGVDRLVLVCPTDSSMGNRNVWVRGLVRSPVLGEGLFNLITSKASLRHFNADHGYYDPDALSDAVLDYEYQTAHQPGARFAPASFLSGFLDPETELADALQAVDAPVTLVWGRNAEVVPLNRGRELAETADAGFVVFDQAKLLPHCEHPGQFVSVVRDDIAVEQ
jgi:pimeloyl-ACP methyl ester carboxylesterase